MIPHYTKIHNRFCLNGIHYDLNGLKECAYSFVKEGDPYEKIIGDFLLDWFDEKDTLRVKTSGSTGRPKTIALKKQSMVNSAIATGDYFKLKPGDTALHCLSTEFIAGKMMFVRAFILGLELELVAPSSQPLINSKRKYNFCAMVPMQAENSIEHLNQIKTLIIGGANVSDILINKLQLTRAKVYTTYGMTETITHIAVRKLNNYKEETPLYQTLPNISISQDSNDCLLIEAAHLFEGKVKTNDIVKLYSESTFEFLGRLDNVINSGGIKLYPEQIEAKLSKYIKQRFFIASKKDATFGDKVVLIIEGNESTSDRIRKRIETIKTLDKYEVPKEIFSIPQFIITDSGKIQRDKTSKLVK